MNPCSASNLRRWSRGLSAGVTGQNVRPRRVRRGLVGGTTHRRRHHRLARRLSELRALSIWTWSELTTHRIRVRLRKLAVKRADRIMGYLPNLPETSRQFGAGLACCQRVSNPVSSVCTIRPNCSVSSARGVPDISSVKPSMIAGPMTSATAASTSKSPSRPSPCSAMR